MVSARTHILLLISDPGGWRACALFVLPAAAVAATYHVGHSTITGDPRFARLRPAGPGRDTAIAAYSALRGSAALAAGRALPEQPTHDFAGRPVVIVDVGALGLAS